MDDNTLRVAALGLDRCEKIRQRPDLSARCLRGVTKGRVVPIQQFLGDNRAFGPEDLNAMGAAFSAALNKLGLHDLKDPMTEMVARRIVRAALAGERDPIRLTEFGTGGREPA
jgi:hypothetical protein